MRPLSLLGASLVLAAASASPALPAGPEFQVNTGTVGDQGYPAACVDARGDATVARESRVDGVSTVRTRRFDAAGAAAPGAGRVALGLLSR